MELVQFDFPLIFSLLVQSVKVSVHKVNCQECGLVGALEGRDHFDHPVNHLCSVDTIDLVVAHVVCFYPVNFLQLVQIGVDIGTVVANKVVFSFLLGILESRKYLFQY